MVTVIRNSYWEMQILSGFRYLDLLENFDLLNTSTDIIAWTFWQQRDHFQTRNQFYGGELGLAARLNGPIVFVEMAGKVAIGVNHQKVDIFGKTTGGVGAWWRPTPWAASSPSPRTSGCMNARSSRLCPSARSASAWS